MAKRNLFKIIIKQIYLSLRQFLIYLFVYPFHKKKAISQIKDIKRILVIRIDRIGDLVASLPILKVLKEIFPLATVSILVRRGNESLLNGFPYVDEVILYRGFIKTVRYLRQKGFDLSIDLLMDYPIKPALLAYFSKAKFVAGFDINLKGFLFNIKCKAPEEKKRVSQHILDLAKVIAKLSSWQGIAWDSFYPEIPISEQSKNYLRFFLKEKGFQEKDFLVGIHPGGYYPSQRWPVERFSELTNEIIQRYRVKVVVIGSQDEEALVEQMIGFMKEEVVKVVGLALDKLASLISLMDLFIGNNSGPLHIACAVGTPTISTMGPTDPVLWWPSGTKHIVIRKELNCSPCNKAKCKKHYCMDRISIEEMLQAVSLQIKRHPN